MADRTIPAKAWVNIERAVFRDSVLVPDVLPWAFAASGYRNPYRDPGLVLLLDPQRAGHPPQAGPSSRPRRLRGRLRTASQRPPDVGPEEHPVARESAMTTVTSPYRYTLRRSWACDLLNRPRAVTFVMLNPSTADDVQDDRTIRRCVGFARSWGCNELHVLNLYAYRSTDPAGLWDVPDPVGPDNDLHLANGLLDAQARGELVIAAWGINARPDRVAHVLGLQGGDRFNALAVTRDGHPGHPLRLRGTALPRPWPTAPAAP